MDANNLKKPTDTQPLLPKFSTHHPNPNPPNTLHGYTLMLLSTFAFATMSFLVHTAETSYSFPSTSSAFIRGIIHTTLSTLYLLSIRHTTPLLSHLTLPQRLLLLLRAITGSLDLILLYLALNLLPVGDAVTLFFCGPIFTLLLSTSLLKEPVNRLELLAASISFIGIILVARPTLTPTLHQPTSRIYGSIAALLAAFLSAVTYIAVRRLGTAIHFMTSVWSFSAATIVTATALGGVIGPVEMMANPKGAVLTVVAAGFAFGGQCCLNRGLQLCRAGPGILIRNLDVPIAYGLGLVFLGERPSWLGLGGSGLVIFGTVIIGMVQVMRLRGCEG